MEEINPIQDKPNWNFKRAIKNTFTWDKDDWKYIKTHIVWILIVLLLSVLYYSEVKQAREFIGSSCVHQCQIKNYIENFKKLNPTIQIQCDYELGSCQYAGVYNSSINEMLRGFNLTINASNG